MSIGFKTPAVAHLEQGEQEKMWKNKDYPKKQNENENNVVSLPSRTNSPELCVSSMTEVSTKTTRLFRLCQSIQYDS